MWEIMDGGQEELRAGGMQDRRNAGHEGCRSGWMQERRKTGKMGAEHLRECMVDRRNSGQEGMQDRRNAGHEGFRSGWMHERRKTGKMGAEHGKKIILSCVETFVTFYAKTCNISIVGDLSLRRDTFKTPPPPPPVSFKF